MGERIIFEEESNRIIGACFVEVKAAKQLTDEHRAQVLNYLKCTGKQLGLLVNSGHHSKIEHERLVNEPLSHVSRISWFQGIEGKVGSTHLVAPAGDHVGSTFTSAREAVSGRAFCVAEQRVEGLALFGCERALVLRGIAPLARALSGLRDHVAG